MHEIKEHSSDVYASYRKAHPHNLHPVNGHFHSALDNSKTSTGIIWATEQATEKGFQDNPEEWGNLGQGAPETGEIEGGVLERPTKLEMKTDDLEYGPTNGIKPLREAVAKLYNEMHRGGKESLYTYENVAIVPGGRAGLTRIAAVLGNVYVSYMIPEYVPRAGLRDLVLRSVDTRHIMSFLAPSKT